MKKKNRFNDLLKTHWFIFLIMIIGVILNIMVFKELGYKYTLNSDDLSYINSGITFLKTKTITMHGVLSAQTMPGMTFIISLFAFIFGTGSKLWLALKIFWILMGLITIIIVYKISKLYIKNNIIAAIPCIFFLSADYIWMNNIILTETPYILSFVLLIYYSLKYSIDKNNKDYYKIIIMYIICLFIRPNIALYPIFLIIFLLIKKFDFKDLLKKCFIAGIILLCVLTPWIYRNYKLFNKFIPLTYGTGNPLLLGTYQGVGYPSDEELDYKNVDDKMSKEMKLYLTGNPKEKLYLKKYYALEYDGMKAKYRIGEWWKKDKVSMLKSYLIYKPKEMIYSIFYWKEVLGIKSSIILLIRKIEIILFGLSSILIIITRKYIKEWIFLILLYLSQIVLYSYTFAYSRYAVTLYFIRYLIVGFGLYILYSYFKNRSKGEGNESINNNSRIQRRIKY